MTFISSKLSIATVVLYAIIFQVQSTDIICPNDITINCIDDLPAEYDYDAFIDEGGMASDTTHGIDQASLIVNEDETLENCTTMVVRTYEISNNNGEIANCNHTILAIDTISPIVECIDSIVQEEDPESSGFATVSINSALTISDNCGNELIINNDFNNSDDASGEYSIGTTNVTWTVMDECGNTSTCTTKVIVEEIEIPEITCPANNIVECLFDAPEAYNTLNEFMNAGGTINNIAIINESSFSLDNEVEVGDDCSGTISRTYYVEDENGLSATCIQLIESDDQTNPVFTICPPSLITEIPNLGDINTAVTSITQPEGLDNCDTDITYSYSINGNAFEEGVDANGVFDLGVSTITWKITDACGNFADNCTTEVIVTDITVPQIVCPDAIIVSCLNDIPDAFQNTDEFEAGGGSITHANGNNNIDISTFSVSEDILPSDNCNKGLARTYTIEDFNGNVASCQAAINIDDKEAPVLITNLDTLRLSTGDSIPEAKPQQLKFTSNCADEIQVEHVDDISDLKECPDTIIRTYKATDACGNATLIQQVILFDCATGIQFNDFTSISVFPVPFNNYLNLSGDLSLLNRVEILDITGKLIIQQNSQFNSINTVSLKEGIYLLKAYLNNQVQTLKILKN